MFICNRHNFIDEKRPYANVEQTTIDWEAKIDSGYNLFYCSFDKNRCHGSNCDNCHRNRYDEDGKYI